MAFWSSMKPEKTKTYLLWACTSKFKISKDSHATIIKKNINFSVLKLRLKLIIYTSLSPVMEWGPLEPMHIWLRIPEKSLQGYKWLNCK